MAGTAGLARNRRPQDYIGQELNDEPLPSPPPLRSDGLSQGSSFLIRLKQHALFYAKCFNQSLWSFDLVALKRARGPILWRGDWTNLLALG